MIIGANRSRCYYILLWAHIKVAKSKESERKSDKEVRAVCACARWLFTVHIISCARRIKMFRIIIEVL
uniref:Uncharacterized protein n=1 Tax=Trichogramma kaykai TaxID=54128 RepID=A0ABD2X436_9HYME